MNRLTIRTMTLVLAAAFGAAHAKLPELGEEAKAAAAAAKDKTAWGDKVMAYQVCLAQDKVAAYYFKTKEGSRNPATAVPPCADPGPYIALLSAQQQVGVADSKPVPAAGKVEPGSTIKK